MFPGICSTSSPLRVFKLTKHTGRRKSTSQMHTTPHSFLVGITRIIAIYFGIRSIDQLTGGIFAYYLQTSVQVSMSPEMAHVMPSVFAIYIPAFLLYVALTVGVWYGAPCICRLAMANQPDAEPEQHNNVIVWNSVVIFLMGTFFVGWGITRTAEDFTPYFHARANHLMFTLHVGTQIHIIISLLLICFGAIFMSRFTAVHHWIVSRSKVAHAPVEDGKSPESNQPSH